VKQKELLRDRRWKNEKIFFFKRRLRATEGDLPVEFRDPFFFDSEFFIREPVRKDGRDQEDEKKQHTGFA
jgi:hypothetical protein